MLDKDLISQSHLWTMGLLIGRKNIDAVFFPPVGSDDIIYRSIPLDPVAPSRLKAVEDAIYDNPLLLNQYRAIFAAIDTNNFIILPDNLGPSADALAPRAISLATGQPEPADSLLLRDAAGTGASLFYEAPTPLIGFLRRTFFNVSLTHPLASLAAWCLSSTSQAGQLTASLRDNRLDLVATQADKLLLANTFTFESLADAAYYTLAVRSRLPFTATSRIIVAGPPSLRSEFQRIVSLAAPGLPAPESALLPHQLLSGGAAVASTPFCLILKSLQ